MGRAVQAGEVALINVICVIQNRPPVGDVDPAHRADCAAQQTVPDVGVEAEKLRDHVVQRAFDALGVDRHVDAGLFHSAVLHVQAFDQKPVDGVHDFGVVFRFFVGVGLQIFEEFTQVVDRGGFQHVRVKPVLLRVGRHVVDRLGLAGFRIDEGAGVGVDQGVDVEVFADLAVHFPSGHGDDARRGRVADQRGGFNVEEAAALFGRHFLDIVGVHMAGEDAVHPSVGEGRRNPFVLGNQVGGHGLGLHRKMGQEAVVAEPDDRVALGFRRAGLLEHPGLELRGENAGGLVFVDAADRCVCAVTVGVHHDEGEARLRAHAVGQAAAQFSFWRHEALHLCGAEAFRRVEVPKDGGGGALGGYGFAVWRIEIRGVRVVDVVVARCGEHLGAGIPGELLENGRDRLVAFPFAVLGQVPGDHQYVWVLCCQAFQRRFQKGVTLVVHLAVAVAVLGVVRGVGDQRRRQIVQVSQYGDFQGLMTGVGLILICSVHGIIFSFSIQCISECFFSIILIIFSDIFNLLKVIFT